MSYKIDFTTFPTASVVNDQESLDVPVGKWFVLCKCECGQKNANDYWYAVCDVTGLDTQEQTCAGPAVAASVYLQQSWGNMCFFGIVETDSGTTLTLHKRSTRNVEVKGIKWMLLPYFR